MNANRLLVYIPKHCSLVLWLKSHNSKFVELRITYGATSNMDKGHTIHNYGKPKISRQ